MDLSSTSIALEVCVKDGVDKNNYYKQAYLQTGGSTKKMQNVLKLKNMFLEGFRFILDFFSQNRTF